MKPTPEFSQNQRPRLQPLFLWSSLFLAGCLACPAEVVIQRKDGTQQSAQFLRREKNEIIAKTSATVGEVRIPLAQISRIDFAEPAALKTAPELLLQGKGTEALAELDAALPYYEGFRDAPGSWWPDLLLMKMNALISLGREQEAGALADGMNRESTDPEARGAATVVLAVAAIQGGDPASASKSLDAVMTSSNKANILAAAAIYKGQSCLALKDWEKALLSFLQVPVLYPEQKALAPASMLGVARAHVGLEDFPLARTALKELMRTYKGTPEAAAAKAEMESIVKRERALSDTSSGKSPADAK